MDLGGAAGTLLPALIFIMKISHQFSQMTTEAKYPADMVTHVSFIREMIATTNTAQ